MLCLAAAVVLCTGITAIAGSEPIKTVSIRVTSKLEPGQKLPDIQIGNSSAEDRQVSVSASNSNYSLTAAEWVDDADYGVEVAAEPRMKVTLEPEDVSEHYFSASYKESNVKISGGKFVSAKRDGDALVVTLRVKAVKGDFEPPKDAYWDEKNLGEAKWVKAELDSGYYEVQLYREKKKIYSIDRTTAKNYNFYPYMTEAGEYTFKVRCIPGTDIQGQYGKKSDWVESGELDITDRYVSDGKGQKNSNGAASKGTTEKVGWFKEGDIWSYRYPDGSLARGGWLDIDGHWYYFDVDARMMTGWLDLNGNKYYLQESGQMAEGWARIDQKWYYFLPFAEDGQPAGALARSGWRVIGPYYYYINDDGSARTGWLHENGHLYYLNELDKSLQCAMLTGWFERDGKTYYTNSRGEMVEGWWEIDGSYYYFMPGDGSMARDTRIDGMYLGTDGVWVR